MRKAAGCLLIFVLFLIETILCFPFQKLHTVSKTEMKSYSSILKIWLITGLAMIFLQVIIGGVTRLTGSGLSITKWDIVTGALPPMNEAGWQYEFELYQQTPQYQKINQGMSLSEFKFIYFWEYFHRLWARLMGFVFIIPFFIFWRKGWIDRPLMRKLGMVVLLAAIVAAFGWIMVASGLVNRPWVNAYKLTLHLSLAIITFCYLLWTIFWVFKIPKLVFHNSSLKRWINTLLIMVSIQIMLGGLMSGMKAALVYPTWPLMHSEFIPSLLFDLSNWRLEHLVDYDKNPFMPALVQVLHRFLAYALTISGLWFILKFFRSSESVYFKNGMSLWAVVLIAQVLLGIFTLINSVGVVPVGLGVWHQAMALVLLSITLFLRFLVSRSE